MAFTKVRQDLMSTNFPSIWVEANETGQKLVIICGFYRVWTIDGIKSTAEQLKNLEMLNQQITKGTEQAKKCDHAGRCKPLQPQME